MNIFEIELDRMQKRLKRLEEREIQNPDPTRLQSNKLLYQIEIEQRQAQLQALSEGKKFGVVWGLLGQSMGFIPADAGITIPQDAAMKYFDEVRTKGQVGDACDMSIVTWAQRDHVVVPEEKFSVIEPEPCTVQFLASLQYASREQKHNNRIIYYMDKGFEENEANLEHMTNQLHELIELIEKTYPDYKFDENKLGELQKFEEKALDHYKEIYEMLRHKPSPLGGFDAFIQTGAPFVPGIWPNPARAVEYAKAKRDEIAERIEKGIFAIPDEKARVVWTVTRPFFMDNFKPLQKWKIVVPLFYSGLADLRIPIPHKQYWGDRKLSPLEKEAARRLRGLWSGTGDAWVKPLMWICRDLGIDGIVNYCQRGATCTLGLKKLVEDTAEKELGIPTLQLEGAQWDTNYRDEKAITAQLEEFAQLILSRKGLL
ncbi:MAG: 2-hydroxyacyl-CoA dehydratase [Dehalococcoidales bacterium]|nr:2-hydroxyacyl-CoA dehydratase [Dehalococcoidales bacterium]